ncbi:MAG TPA: cupredoxin domain-containing protein [Actinomycetota bacterium]|nr:cupredoxin domain-containing protein [Actinomycetota bacterium]
MRRRGGMVIGVLAGVLALGLAGCGGGDEGASASATTAAETTASQTSGGGGNELQLTAQGTAWDPTSFDLTAGSSYTVEVRNQDSIEHNFTFTDGNANQDIEGGEDAKVTFTAPAAGSYQFICKYHPAAMKGTITVT